MTKEDLYAPIYEKYNELKIALTGTDIDKIRELTLEVHAMVHPAEISGKTEKTIADFVLDYMLKGNQNAIVPREDYDVDLHYAGTSSIKKASRTVSSIGTVRIPASVFGFEICCSEVREPPTG